MDAVPSSGSNGGQDSSESAVVGVLGSELLLRPMLQLLPPHESSDHFGQLASLKVSLNPMHEFFLLANDIYLIRTKLF